jgi:hypothetical protein
MHPMDRRIETRGEGNAGDSAFETSMSNQKIRVVYGDIKRESVLIDPSVSVSQSETDTDQKNVLAHGQSTKELLQKKYGKR